MLRESGTPSGREPFGWENGARFSEGMRTEKESSGGSHFSAQSVAEGGKLWYNTPNGNTDGGKRVRKAKRWVIPCLCGMLGVQLLAYYATRLPLWHAPLRNLTIPLDGRIPFRSGWITVYVLSYVTWLVNGLWILSEGEAHAYRFAGAYAVAMVISAAVFILFPATIQRPEVTGSGLTDALTRLIYRLDTPTNLCPSLHVMANYFCWRGTWGCRGIPGWYKAVSFGYLVLVCLSILLVKQHLFVDIPCALAVGEVSLQLARALKLERVGFSLARAFAHDDKEGKDS